MGGVADEWSRGHNWKPRGPPEGKRSYRKRQTVTHIFAGLFAFVRQEDSAPSIMHPRHWGCSRGRRGVIDKKSRGFFLSLYFLFFAHSLSFSLFLVLSVPGKITGRSLHPAARRIDCAVDRPWLAWTLLAGQRREEKEVSVAKERGINMRRGWRCLGGRFPPLLRPRGSIVSAFNGEDHHVASRVPSGQSGLSALSRRQGRSVETL